VFEFRAKFQFYSILTFPRVRRLHWRCWNGYALDVSMPVFEYERLDVQWNVEWLFDSVNSILVSSTAQAIEQGGYHYQFKVDKALSITSLLCDSV